MLEETGKGIRMTQPPDNQNPQTQTSQTQTTQTTRPPLAAGATAALTIAVIGDVHDRWDADDAIALKHLGVDLVLLGRRLRQRICRGCAGDRGAGHSQSRRFG